MAESDSERDIFEEARDAVEQARRRADRESEQESQAPSPPAEQLPDLESLRELYDRNPYAVLAAAAGAGYVLGGGLLTPFTKRLTRMGMKALVVPVALSRLKEMTNDGEALPDGSD